MNEYEKISEQEQAYLDKVIKFLRQELSIEEASVDNRLKKLIATGNAMWTESSHAAMDFDKIPEMNDYLMDLNLKADHYNSTLKKIMKYRSMLSSPYFGRFDFLEQNYDTEDMLYIGLYNLFDKNANEILVYDWRSPVAGMFYQYEIGKASYMSPKGEITGQLLNKRQYKIENSILKYYFDSSLRINDEILQEVLGQNTSSKMKNIVETIQKEQDLIIRDNKNELLLVQGVAGSGKTSVALHRIAFLLYTGMGSKLNSNNVLIISPNSIFSQYISGVLPELGEDNVQQYTFDELSNTYLSNQLTIENKSSFTEKIISEYNSKHDVDELNFIEFKGSKDFSILLERYIKYYEHNLIYFKDIYFEGEIIETKQLLKATFLNNKISIPPVRRLQRMESIILEKLKPLRQQRLNKLEKIVAQGLSHELEVKSYSRLLSLKRTKVFTENTSEFFKLDYLKIYSELFKDKQLFLKLARGLSLPRNLDELLLSALTNLKNSYIPYEDLAPLLYIKFKIEGFKSFSDIKHVIIDEAQDYTKIQYEVFKLMFTEASYTVLGDINQSTFRPSSSSIYDDIEATLGNRSTLRLTMNKSYRSSLEISSFSAKIIGKLTELITFERHEAYPEVIKAVDLDAMISDIRNKITQLYDQGYKSLAIITKTQSEASSLNTKLSESLKANKGEISIIPIYMAKGLEYDGVIIFNTSSENYNTELDRQLLYIACTRALHHLTLYYIGDQSSFIPCY